MLWSNWHEPHVFRQNSSIHGTWSEESLGADDAMQSFIVQIRDAMSPTSVRHPKARDILNCKMYALKETIDGDKTRWDVGDNTLETG